MSDFKGFAALGYLFQQAAHVHSGAASFSRGFAGFAVAGSAPARKGIDDALKAAGEALTKHFQQKVLEHGPGWQGLAEGTVEERLRYGFTPDDQLFRTTQMFEAIGWERTGGIGFNIGINDHYYDRQIPGRENNVVTMGELFDWHEYGTSKMPARPIFTAEDAEPHLQAVALTFGEQAIKNGWLRNLNKA